MRSFFSVLAASFLACVEARAADVKPAPTPLRREDVKDVKDVKTIVGQIVSVDASASTIVVGESLQSSRPKTSEKVRESVTLTVDAKTQLFRGKSPATQADLHAKDHVVVHYVLTPQGARAVSCRISDTVARPSPTAAASAVAPGGAGAAAAAPN